MFKEELLGEWVPDRCPRCGHRLLANGVGDEWCGAYRCTWMDKEEDEKDWASILELEEEN